MADYQITWKPFATFDMLDRSALLSMISATPQYKHFKALNLRSMKSWHPLWTLCCTAGESSVKPGRAAGLQLQVQTETPSADVYGQRLTAGTALVPRLLPSRVLSTPYAFSLMPQPRGALANLKPMPLTHASMTKLQPGQVLLQVHSVGLNFRDVLNVLGMYPGDPGPPGADCAGVVVATGAGVTHLTPGMAVFGLAPGSLGSHVVSGADTLVSLQLYTAICCAHKQQLLVQLVR